MSSSSFSPSSKGQSNLESFLHSVTPVVPSRQLSMKLQQAVDTQGNVECFSLGDLWRIYDEWSAYGVGIHVILSSGESIVQYYTPHLSAIQLYTNSDNSSKRWGSASDARIAHHSLRRVRECDPPAYLHFQYDEPIAPYWRVPFTDKIGELAESLPILVSLKSAELSLESWMSVEWSPIYHIPFKGKFEDLSTHFLTFHKLSSYSQDTQGSDDIMSQRNISLPPFGLSTLNMQGDVWINHNSGDRDKLIDLHHAADSWLTRLGAHNRDFDYYQKKNLEARSPYLS